MLDSNGNLKADDPANNYELWGTVTFEGQTFTGLLLKGTPTGFGFLDLNPIGIPEADAFNATLKIESGALKPYFDGDTSIQIITEQESTFVGLFDHDFTGGRAISHTQSFDSLPSLPPY